MFGTVWCDNNDNKNSVPEPTSIPSEHSVVEDYYKYVIKDNEAIQVYKTENVYLLFYKKTYKARECIYNDDLVLDGLTYSVELYELENEEMLVYSNGIDGLTIKNIIIII